MNVYTTVISIVLVIIIVSAIAIIRKRNTEKGVVGGMTMTDIYDCFLRVTEASRSLICDPLESLAGNKPIEACRKHRTETDSMREVEKQIKPYLNTSGPTDDSVIIYIGYLTETAEKIAEISCRIATLPEYEISSAERWEILSICDRLQELLPAPSGTSAVRHDTEKSSAMETALERMIAQQQKSMKHEDFNDGAPAYLWLTLLYYLHSFVNAYHHIISTPYFKAC